MRKADKNYKRPVLWISFVCIVVLLVFFIFQVTKPVKHKEDVVNSYICEQIGFLGIFTIDIYEDGTFCYYEGVASSVFGEGKWELEGNKLTFYDESRGSNIKEVFTVDRHNNLVFNKRESKQFGFVALEDGIKFIPKDKITEEQLKSLDKQLDKQIEGQKKEALESEYAKEDYIILYPWEFANDDEKATLIVDASKHHEDSELPIEISLITKDDRVLWEDSIGSTYEDWDSYFLCHKDSTDYLIQYRRNDEQGIIDYAFSMFTIDFKGNIITKCEFYATSEDEIKDFKRKIKSILFEAKQII